VRTLCLYLTRGSDALQQARTLVRIRRRGVGGGSPARSEGYSRASSSRLSVGWTLQSATHRFTRGKKETFPFISLSFSLFLSRRKHI
jgi:hypothetical protein